MRARDHGCHVGHGFLAEAVVDIHGGAEDVCVTLLCGHLAAGDRQDIVVERLDFAHQAIERDIVVVGDGREIEMGGQSGIHGAVERAGHVATHAAGAEAIAMAGVEVEVAAIPLVGHFQRLGRKGRYGRRFARPPEPDAGGIARCHAFADVGYAQIERPAPPADRPGDERGGGVVLVDHDGSLVAAAPATEGLSVEQADVDHGLPSRRVYSYSPPMRVIPPGTSNETGTLRW